MEWASSAHKTNKNLKRLNKTKTPKKRKCSPGRALAGVWGQSPHGFSSEGSKNLFTTLNISVTGLRAAQTGLVVTSHNMANAEINGFSRQRSLQADLRPRGMGTSMSGQRLFVGTGVDNQAVEQIRSQYFDFMFRAHNMRLSFYSTLTSIGHHIESVLGETESSFRMQVLLADMWNSLHEMSMDVSALETREAFVATSIAFLDKAQVIFNELFQFQQNLDGQIRNMVADINDIVANINRLNDEITGHEMSGDNANDLRDERNRLMDQLSGLIPVEFFEDTGQLNPVTGQWERGTGRIDIMTISGNFILSQGSQNTLGLLQISGRYTFVEPVFTSATEVLPPDTPPSRYRPLFNWDRPIDAERGNDQGALLALLSARGAMPATFAGIDALWEPIALPGSIFGVEPPAGGYGSVQEVVEHMIGQRLGLEWGFTPSTAGPPPEWDAIPRPEWNATTNTWDNIPPSLAGMGDPEDENNSHLLHAQLVWDNQRNNIESLYPEMIRDPAGFVAAVNAGIGNQDFDRMNGTFQASRRTYRQANWSMNNALIPRVMRDMDKIVNTIVRLINDSIAPVRDHTFDPDAPFDLNGNKSFTEVFVRRSEGGLNLPRFDGNRIHNSGLPGQIDSFYSTRNLMINPALRLPGGYNLLALSLSGERDDATLVNEMIRQWTADDSDFKINIGGEYFNIDRAYAAFITALGTEIMEAETFMTAEFQQLLQADQRRNSIMGVSLDEETASMMTFQFAYQAASRLFNIIDSMIDTVINRTGRVGL